MTEPQQDHVAPESTAPSWRKPLMVLLVTVVGVAIATRVLRAYDAEERREARRATASQLVPGTPEERQEARREKIDEVLPYITEGGLAMIVGLLLGMATRGFIKLGLLLGIVAFAGLQYLAYKGILTVDWSAIKDFVFNIQPEAGWATFIRQKIPSGGAFGLGYLLGLKRG